MILNKIRNNKNNMFFLWAGINIKLMILRIFQSLLRRKLYTKKIENAFFSSLCLVLTSKFSGVGSKHWRGGAILINNLEPAENEMKKRVIGMVISNFAKKSCWGNVHLLHVLYTLDVRKWFFSQLKGKFWDLRSEEYFQQIIFASIFFKISFI